MPTTISKPQSVSKSAPEAKPTQIPLSRIWALVTPFDKFELCMAILGLIGSSANNLMMPKIVGNALNRSIGGAFSTPNQNFLIMMLSLFGLGSFFGWLRVYCFGHVASKVELKLKFALYKSILNQKINVIQETSSGKFINTMTQDVKTTVTLFSKVLPNFFRSFNSIIGAGSMLMLISPKLTLLTISIVPIIGTGAILFSKFISKLRKVESQNFDSVISMAQERVTNIVTVRQFGMQQNEVMKFKNSLENIIPLTSNILNADGIFMGGLSLSLFSALLVILFTGGSLLKAGEFTTGSLTSFALYSGMVGLGSSNLSTVISGYSQAKLSMSRVFEIIDNSVDESTNGIILPEVKGHIKFDNVSFKYPNSEKNVFENFSFEIAPNQILAITGVSGVGKTTIFNLLTGLYSPQNGHIEIDGYDISQLNKNWILQSFIGVVNQENHLFAGTINENIKFGKYEATDDEVIKASEMASAHTFIDSLPDKYHTHIGEKGFQLSAGQKQRICLARAIIKNPSILLLDEATSSLDANSEKAIHTALESVKKGRSVILISHRESTLKFAQRIIFIKDELVHISGSYKDLLKHPEFCQLIQNSD